MEFDTEDQVLLLHLILMKVKSNLSLSWAWHSLYFFLPHIVPLAVITDIEYGSTSDIPWTHFMCSRILLTVLPHSGHIYLKWIIFNIHINQAVFFPVNLWTLFAGNSLTGNHKEFLQNYSRLAMECWYF